MEQSQLETIHTICQNMQLMASVLQEFVRKKQKPISDNQNTSCLYKYDFFAARSIPNIC